MEEKKLSERESLEVIMAMINRTKERYMLGDGNILLMWGYVVIAVSALVWALLALTHNPAVNWLWFLIWIIGGIATPVMARKKQIDKGVKSLYDKIISRLWSIVGYATIAAVLSCLGFLLIGGKDSWAMMFEIALIIVPIVEMAQGVLLDEKCFIVGGAIGLAVGIFTMCCLAGGVTLYAYWYMPLLMVTIAVMMILPGHTLNYKARHRK